MHNFYYLQSFELLCFLSISGKEDLQSVNSTQGEIAEKLDNHFSVTEYSEILNKIHSSGRAKILSGDNLFINYDTLKLDYFNKDILTPKERLIIYTCITSWIQDLRLTDIDLNLLQKILLIDKNTIDTIASFLLIDKEKATYVDNEIFLLEPVSHGNESLDGKWVMSNLPKEIAQEKHFYSENISSTYKILFIGTLKIFLLRNMGEKSILNKNGIRSICGWEFLEPGDMISEKASLYFDYFYLKQLFLEGKITESLTLQFNNISYSYAARRGISKLDIAINSGTLVGILGREGTGKSTLLNLLAGEIKPATGDITINGYSYHNELYHLKGMIGYVPEEDMLFDELTVFDNLYYSAKLYLGNISEDIIRKRVRKLLEELDLWEISNKVVGSLKDKHLQPGQRRILNIGLELIRDPQLLIVDNAIASLSLSDSSKIIEVLSDYSFRGRIVITSITQTDKKTFQYFDKLLLLDEGGFPVLFQKSNEAWKTLSSALGFNREQYYQPSPNDLLKLLDPPYNSQNNNSLLQNKTAEELHELYKEYKSDEETPEIRKRLPKNILSPPTLDRQYVILSLRNFKAKLARKRELVGTLLASPIIAFLLSLILRGSSTHEYEFFSNQNIPEFFFISSIVAIFLGLVLSSKEIFRERTINKKQEYLNVSKFSYINSKITYLFTLILIQSFLFVFISHSILQIRGMYFMHWLIFFSCEAFGVLIGLVFSENQTLLETIYSRTIPFILLLQLLFGGGLIRLDTLPGVGAKGFTPFVSDLMVARWAHETLMVYQFRNNSYNKPLYPIERNLSSGFINSFYLIPELEADLEYCSENYRSNPDSTNHLLMSISNELKKLRLHFDIFPYENIDLLNSESFNSDIATDLGDYLEYLDFNFLSLYQDSESEKGEYEKSISDSLGESYLNQQKLKYMNRAVNGEVSNAGAENILSVSGQSSVQLIDQIYQYPNSNLGRAQLFQPEKMINGQIIDTIEFNISIIWLINLLIYVLLVTGVVSKIRSA